MNTINQTLSIGTPKSGMDLFCNVGIDGEHLFRMHCESFVGNLLRDVHGMMHGGKTDRLISPGDDYVQDGKITSLHIVDGALEIYSQYYLEYIFNGMHGVNPNGEKPVWIHIWGCSSVPQINGTWQVESTHGDYYIRLKDAPIDFDSATYVADQAQVIAKHYHPITTTESYCPPFRVILPTIGQGNRPVSISDVGLHNPIDALLARGARSVSGVVTDQQKSVFTVSAPFTNNSGGDLVITEMGLMTHINVNRHEINTIATLYARDVLPAALNLPNGKTLTLDYECRFELENFNQDTDLNGSNGGFTAEFVGALRKQTVENTNTNWRDLMCIGGGGTSMTSLQRRASEVNKAWHLGLRMGQSNKYVSMTDTDLSPDATQETPYNLGGVTHGSGDGQLIHHGMIIDDQVTIDEVNNEAYFNLARVFENRGATDITVKEVGIYANRGDDYDEWVPKLVARKALAPADQFTIMAGQMRKVNYKIKMVV